MLDINQSPDLVSNILRTSVVTIRWSGMARRRAASGAEARVGLSRVVM